MSARSENDIEPRDAQTARQISLFHLARWVFVSFIFTFIAARVLVYLIMARIIPDFYLYVGGTHIHHLNYGIFLLSGVGAYLLFARTKNRSLVPAAVLYGIGLALTFDEFGMWLHLGGAYWQRASFDALAVIGAALGLLSVAPAIRRFRALHWWTLAAVSAGIVLFAVSMARSFEHMKDNLSPVLMQLEENAPR